MIKQVFYGKSSDGMFEHEAPDYFERFMRALEESGKRLEMTVKVYRRPRSTGKDGEGNQNGYYWAVPVRMIADEIGELDQDLVHEWIQLAVGNFRVMPDGHKVALGTKEMNTVEFEEYCARVRTWAGTPGAIVESGMYIPAPNEVEYE
jgi:hypothetical protein